MISQWAHDVSSPHPHAVASHWDVDGRSLWYLLCGIMGWIPFNVTVSSRCEFTTSSLSDITLWVRSEITVISTLTSRYEFLVISQSAPYVSSQHPHTLTLHCELAVRSMWYMLCDITVWVHCDIAVSSRWELTTSSLSEITLGRRCEITVRSFLWHHHISLLWYRSELVIWAHNILTQWHHCVRSLWDHNDIFSVTSPYEFLVISQWVWREVTCWLGHY